MGTSIYAVICATLVGVLLRWSVSTFPYSGQGQPPKFGDYEAHRHWMEITHNLPLREWYVETSRNNLKYWGLDYPPLSAYHSYVVGLLFDWLIPESMTLHSSRGYESPLHKFLMRLSVSMSDILLPALVIFHMKFANVKTGPVWAPVLLAVAAPPFIMVDYGHFQYNCVSLGLTVAAVIALLSNQMSLTAILFTLAVNHKQMSLYHAIPFFMYMIATVVVRRGDLFTCFRVGSTILSTIGLLWLPFGDRCRNVFWRIFPVKRGIFEDKVGTFWYALDRIVTIKNVVPDDQLARTSAIVCLLLVAPCAVHLLLVISRKKSAEKFGNQVFILSLLNISLIFFLFSYHVHEKTIMLPVLAAVMLLQWYPRSALWFITVSSLSLYPLFHEERSYVALLLITTFYLLVCQQLNVWASISSYLLKAAFILSIGGYATLIAGHHLITPPKKLPHLFPALIALYSFLHFAAFSIYFHSVQLPLNNAGSETSQPHKHKIKKR